MTARYVLYMLGPEDRSTYAECWGGGASPGRRVASSPTLVGLLGAVDGFGHDNWWVRGPGGRNVANSRRDYYRLPAVARELARLRREETAGA